MNEWQRWKNGVLRAGILFGALFVALLILAALDFAINNAPFGAFLRSAVFFLELWVVSAVPILLLSRITHSSRPHLAWWVLAGIGAIAFLYPYGYCEGWPFIASVQLCGSLDTFTLPVYWTGSTLLVVMLIMLVRWDLQSKS